MAEDIIDLADVLERVQNDKELLLELLDIFQEDFVGKRQALAEAIAKKDFTTMKEVAHSIKGSSGNISARRMHETCSQLEQLAKTNNSIGMEDLLKAIDSQFEAIKANAIKLKKEFQG
ncbi:MAG: Hpt domain-containing protein [Candidatus Omnitrophica bacterium]|nr:Hpt domain-containing protein [Candidatus Omnitrophota bacterium]